MRRHEFRRKRPLYCRQSKFARRPHISVSNVENTLVVADRHRPQGGPGKQCRSTIGSKGGTPGTLFPILVNRSQRSEAGSQTLLHTRQQWVTETALREFVRLCYIDRRAETSAVVRFRKDFNLFGMGDSVCLNWP